MWNPKCPTSKSPKICKIKSFGEQMLHTLPKDYVYSLFFSLYLSSALKEIS